MSTFTNRMIRKSALLISVLFLGITAHLSAQTVVHGHESAQGILNFDSLAAAFAAHPPAPVFKQTENEDDDKPPMSARPLVPSLMRYMDTTPTTSGAYASLTSALMPVSVAPTDSFLSNVSDGTSIPPDTQGDIDSNYAVSANNYCVRIQTRAGAAVSLVTLDAFFSTVLPGGGSFDPRVMYDRTVNRWYIVADANGQTATSSLLIAVSNTGNPTGTWHEYIVQCDISGLNWLDYPTCGYNKKWLAVAGNPFSVASGTSAGAQVFFFDKGRLLSGAGAFYTRINQASSFTISPAISYDTTTGSLFCLEEYNYSTASLQFWKVTGAVMSPTMSVVSYPSGSTAQRWQPSSFFNSGTAGADFAPQLGTTNKLQTNDSRIWDTKLINGSVWCSHNVFLPYSTTVNATRCSVQWWQIDTATGNPVQIGLIDDPTNTNFYFFPSIAVNSLSDVLVGFSTSSTAIHPSAGYAIHMHTDATDSTRLPYIYRHGQNTYYQTFSGTKDRWGDYSQASVDPINMLDFWTIQETANSTVNIWNDWWAHILICIPPPATITAGGPTTFCTGGSVVLTANSGTGYTYQWQLAGSPISGATNISYTASAAGNYTVIVSAGGCSTTSAITAVTITTAPTVAAIGGAAAVCVASTITLTDATAGGYWTSVAGTGSATVSATGVVTGVSGGTVTISYTDTNSCGSTTVTHAVTVNPLPTVAAITGTLSTCPTSTSTLADITTGGVWSSATTTVATISATGVVTGVAVGTSAISYTVTLLGCVNRATATFTVTAPPTATATAGGPTTFCAGGSVLLTAGAGAGYTYQWQLGGTAIAGATNNTYSASATGVYRVVVSSGTCSATSSTITVTVNPSPVVAAIGGPVSVCIGSAISLSDATAGGIWTSGTTSVATVSGTGVVTGVSAGSSTISYAVTSAGCTTTVTSSIAVNTLPTVSPITAALLSTCIGSSITLADATTGGTWSSVTPAVATVNTSGVVTGVGAGTDTVKYTVGASGCSATAFALVTVAASGPPAVITPSGATTFCAGSSVTLSCGVGAGYTYQWQVGGTNIAGATNNSYVATATGNYDVIVTSGVCSTTSSITTVTVNATSVAAVTGTTSVCAGRVTTLADVTTGGVWTSSNAAVATVGATTGIVSGVTAGSATITYTVSSACGTFTATATVTVHALPTVAGIAGTTSVCTGGSTLLTDATAGGVWTSGTTSIATVSASGTVTGVATGTDIITYTYTDGFGCSNATTTSFVVNSGPTAVITPAGATTFCPGGSVVLNSTTGTGFTYQWQLGGVNIAGATTSSYTATSGGNYTVVVHQGVCVTTSAIVTITVNTPTVAPIVPATTASVCVGQTIVMTDATTGGVWSSSAGSIATINSTGTVSGVSAGATIISYNYSGVCGPAIATLTVTVNALPTIAPITGTMSVCASGATTTLHDATSGGTWSSSNAGVASISASGVVTGVASGAATITYTYTNASGCTNFVTSAFTVTALPVATIAATGPTTFCSGGYVTLLASAGTGFTYQWKLGGVAITGATNGSYTASAGGNYTVVITNSSGCSSTSAATLVTVTGGSIIAPAVSIAAAPGTLVCIGSGPVSYTATPTNGGTTPTYQWYVNGAAVGTGTGYSYTPSNGDIVRCVLTSNAACAFPDTGFTLVTMTVSPYQHPMVGITSPGGDTACSGLVTTFTAVPMYGGTGPVYVWAKNGANVATGPTYSYMPSPGDWLTVVMSSNFLCRTQDTALSAPDSLHIEIGSTNTVTVIPSVPSVISGSPVTFVASAPHAGPTPSYQWYINGVAVSGATNSSYVTDSLVNGQIVTVAETTSDPCATPAMAMSSGVTVTVLPNTSGVVVTNNKGFGFTLEPNPSKGSFMISGNISAGTDETVTLTINNMLGQTVYSSYIAASNGVVKSQITLDQTLANGVYLVTIRSSDGSKVFHLVLDK